MPCVGLHRAVPGTERGVGCLLPPAAASWHATVTFLANFKVSGPLLLACHVQSFPPEWLSAAGMHLPAAGRPDAITHSQCKPGFVTGVSPLRAR